MRCRARPDIDEPALLKRPKRADDAAAEAMLELVEQPRVPLDVVPRDPLAVRIAAP